MTKRIRPGFALLLILALTLALASGCQPADTTQANQTTAAGTTAAPTTTAQTIDKVTNVMRTDYQVNFAGTEFDQWIQDTFGLEIELNIIDPASYAEKFQIMWNTADLPDISQFAVSAVEVDAAGDNGLLLNGFDYMDVMPTLKQKLTESYDSLPLLTSASGKLYRLPTSYGMGAYLGNGAGIMVRNDLLKAASFDIASIDSADDLYAMFETLKAANPDKYVISTRGSIYSLSNMALHCYGISVNPAAWRESAKEYVACYREPAFKEWLTFWANAYADEILHPEFMNMESSELWQNLYDGSLTAAIDTMANIRHISNNSSVAGSEWTHVIPPKYNGTRYGIPSYCDLDASGNNIIVNAGTKAAEKIMKFIDWTYTNEGYLRTQWGIEDEDYVLINDDPLEFVVLSQSNKDNLPAGYEDKLWTDEERIQRMVSTPYYFYGWYSTNCRWSILGTTIKGKSLYQLGYEAYDEAGCWLPPEPTISLTGNDQTEYTDLNSAIVTMATEAISKIIIGQMAVDDWDSVLADIDNAGYDRLMELLDQSYQEYQKIVPQFTP